MTLKVTDKPARSAALRFLLRPADGKPDKDLADVKMPDSVGGWVIARRDASGCLAVVSLGKVAGVTADRVRQAGGAIVGAMRGLEATRAEVEAPEVAGIGDQDAAVALAEGLLLADFAFDQHKTNPPKRPALNVDLVAKKRSADLTRRITFAQHVCTGTLTAREWAHEPPNVINPVTLADKAKALARKSGLKCTVLDEKALARMKAGGILGVGQGSATPPRMIVLEYPGRGQSAGKPVVLVGKAITFDTGGYSIKTKDGILGMKYDKCGGMTVIGAMQAVAAVKPKTPVVGIIAAAENMISSKAYRPDDIITTLSGKTVQIVSADAEGRMVLCDGLTYAQKKYKPRAIVDLATLTGGVVVALGNECAGIMSNDEALQQALVASGKEVHERLWPLPLWDEYFELLKGDDSDFKNSGSRYAHAIQGGIFLKQFVDSKVPWAHLDIAGVADIDRDAPYCPKGATGFGVRLLLDWIDGL